MNLQTNYLGLTLENPLIAGASGLTAVLESIRGITDAAGQVARIQESLRSDTEPTFRDLRGPVAGLKRVVDPRAHFVVVDVAGQVWLAMVPLGQDAEARRFTAWITTVSEHYRYR